jgi:hypothetical protein
MQGDEVKFASTFTYGAGITVGSGNITFTRNSNSVSTSVSLVGTVAVGDYIGLTTASLNGWNKAVDTTRPNIFYKVTAINTTTITLNVRYGSTTTTVSSIYRLRPNTEIPSTGSASAHAITTASTSVVYEGGYSFNVAGAITRNGSTAFKPVSSGDFNCWLQTDVGSTWRYFGFLDGGRGWVGQLAGNNNLVEFCSANTTLYFAFSMGSTVGSLTARNCWGTNNQGSSNETFILSTPSPNSTVIDCYAINNTSNARPFNSQVGGGVQFQGCRVECSLLGFSTTSGANPITQDCRCILVSGTSAFSGSTSSKFIDCLSETCAVGFLFVGTNNSLYMRGCTINNSSSFGVQTASVFGATIENTTFNSNLIDVNTDQYTSGLNLINCTSNTVSNFHVARVLNNTPITCCECTIDGLSINKAIQIVAGSNYDSPQFYLQNSYSLPDGAYYANGTYTQDTTVFRTSGSSMKLVYSSTISGTTVPIKMASFYVAGGTGKTITYYLKADSGWSGTITPQLRLNGRLIKTETNITSLTTSWVQYTASGTSGEINRDGELSLEFVYNANSVAVWIDDITVS